MPTIKTPGELMEAVNAFRLSRVILTAVELDIFSYLGNEKKSSDDKRGISKRDY